MLHTQSDHNWQVLIDCREEVLVSLLLREAEMSRSQEIQEAMERAEESVDTEWMDAIDTLQRVSYWSSMLLLGNVAGSRRFSSAISGRLKFVIRTLLSGSSTIELARACSELVLWRPISIFSAH
jgi:hypothetical protein